MRIRQMIRPRARIELVPMLDVIFLLLIFFIYTMLSMTVHRGIDVNLPGAQSGVVNKTDCISVSFNKDGEYFLDKKELTLDAVVAELKNKRQENPNLKVIINGDRNAPYGKSIKLLDALRMAGFEEVFFGTETEI